MGRRTGDGRRRAAAGQPAVAGLLLRPEGGGGMRRRVIVGVTGASGSLLALETLAQLKAADVETHLAVTDSARTTIAHELGVHGFERLATAASHVHAHDNLAAPIASGSF